MGTFLSVCRKVGKHISMHALIALCLIMELLSNAYAECFDSGAGQKRLKGPLKSVDRHHYIRGFAFTNKPFHFSTALKTNKKGMFKRCVEELYLSSKTMSELWFFGRTKESLLLYFLSWSSFVICMSFRIKFPLELFLFLCVFCPNCTCMFGEPVRRLRFGHQCGGI